MRKTYQKREENKQAVLAVTATYKVNHSEELMAFLLRKCKTSRNNVKNLLVRRQVLVNGSVVTQYNFPLAKDDEVKLAKSPVRGDAVLRRPTQGKTAQRREPLKIIYEDDDFVAVDKPAGLLSVENEKENECAYGYVAKYLHEKDKNARPYILHRIDKETSGVLVFAKNPKVYSMLKLRWNEYVSLREYDAVVEGVLEEKQGSITSYLKENVNKLMYSTQDKTGQKAITHYTVEKENAVYSLLKVQIDTGRKNQIRVHMQTLGKPVIGDDKYGHTKNPLKRLGLHASKLSFLHPISKEIITITSRRPAVFDTLFS